MIKQILFDCAGVLAQMKFKDTMLKISGSEEVADYVMKNLWREGSPWLLYDKGDLNTSNVLPELKKFMPEEYHTYLEIFVNNLLDALPPMEGMDEIIDALHTQGYSCYLLSNFTDQFEGMFARVPVLKKLDGMVVSYQVRMIKPDREIFLYAAQNLGICPEETLFVDDVLANVEGARSVGMEGYLFTTPEDFKMYLKTSGILSEA